MQRRSAGNNQYMEYLRVRQATTLQASVLDRSMVTTTRLTRNSPNHGFVDQHVAEDAFLLSVQLRDYRGDLWVDGLKVDFPFARKGNFTLYDYNRLWQADMKSEFDCVNFHLPRAALTSLEEDIGPRRIETLNVRPGADVDDPTVRGLVAALLPALDEPKAASRLFLDHMALALAAHVAVTYGEAKEPATVHAGGLAPWQLQRATAMIEANLDGDLPLAAIAAACGLTPLYFVKAFRITVGMTPNRWMLQRRIERSKGLMRTTTLSLAEIATACGFAGQSHFTRSFLRSVGATPGEWRRLILS